MATKRKSKLAAFKEKYLFEDPPGEDRWYVDFDHVLVYLEAGGVFSNRNIVLGLTGTQLMVLNPEMIEADEQVLLDHLNENAAKNDFKGERTFIHFFDVGEDPTILDKVLAFKID